MTVRGEIAESLGETGARSQEEGRQTRSGLLTARVASPHASMPLKPHAGLSQRRVRDCSRSAYE